MRTERATCVVAETTATDCAVDGARTGFRHGPGAGSVAVWERDQVCGDVALLVLQTSAGHDQAPGGGLSVSAAAAGLVRGDVDSDDVADAAAAVPHVHGLWPCCAQGR